MTHEKSTIAVDEKRTHPSIVFFQDTKTFATVAVERATGRVIGCHVPGYRPQAKPMKLASLSKTLWNAQRERLV